MEKSFSASKLMTEHWRFKKKRKLLPPKAKQSSALPKPVVFTTVRPPKKLSLFKKETPFK